MEPGLFLDDSVKTAGHSTPPCPSVDSSMSARRGKPSCLHLRKGTFGPFSSCGDRMGHAVEKLPLCSPNRYQETTYRLVMTNIAMV